MNLTDKITIVTGAASGIGLATARAFAAAGGRVFLGDIAIDKGEQAAAEIRQDGGAAEFVRLDVTDAESVSAFAAEVTERAGAADIVANVAGWDRIEPFIDNTEEYWDKIIDLNLKGQMRVTKAFLPGMMERKSGKVVNVSSDAGRVGSLGETCYAGAKGGVIAFTKSLAREVARHQIHVNCVCPGPTDTPLLAEVPENFRDAFIRATPLRRLATPEEVANAVLFFASARSDFITGQVLSVSGGLTMSG